jgi:glycosyltransferase involved in cell wall biosynthesis
MKDKPLVTVLISTYNYEIYIGKAIESILEQSYPLSNIQVIVIDDGSKDNTKDVVNLYKSKLDLIYIYQENKGKASATRIGIDLARGEYLFVLDADDYLLPNCLDRVVDQFEMYDDAVQVSHLAIRLDEDTGKMTPQVINHTHTNQALDGKYLIERKIFHGEHVGMGSTFAIRTSAIKGHSPIPDDVDMYIDYYLFLVASSKGKIIQLNDHLSIFRRHTRSYSEGVQKIENNKVRSLRYLKSAKALFEESQSSCYDRKLKGYFQLFYLQHLLESVPFLDVNKVNVSIKLLFLTIRSMPYYNHSSRFLWQNLKLIFK